MNTPSFFWRADPAELEAAIAATKLVKETGCRPDEAIEQVLERARTPEVQCEISESRAMARMSERRLSLAFDQGPTASAGGGLR